ncbi:MAG: radical SAM protein [Polyangiaceae bacterium]
MSLTAFLQVPELRRRYEKIKKFFYVRESTYDVTSACQLSCDGCYYYEGDKYKVRDNRSPEAWRLFFESEKERGVNYVVLAGAEPSLVPKIIQACHDVIPFGTVASNGLRAIDRELRYRVHLSVWGDGTGDPKYRKYANGKPGPYCLPIQLTNYRNDDRVVFVYTFNDQNVDEVDEVLRRIDGDGHRITFNVFSAPDRYNSPLQLRYSREHLRDKMVWAIDKYPQTVIYSYYNAVVHTSEHSLHELFGCPYPRAIKSSGLKGLGVSRTFRSYRADHTHTQDADCCVPDIDCSDCRHYAAGSVIVTSRMNLHVGSEAQFRGWLDYVDTYLAVWLPGYERDANLYRFTGHDPAPRLDPLHLLKGPPGSSVDRRYLPIAT